MNVVKLVSFIIFMYLPIQHVNAALIQASWPGPGTPSFSSSGAGAAFAGGRNWELTAFNESAYDELYYTLAAGIGLGSAQSMSFDQFASDLPNGVSIWTNTWDIDLYNSGTSTWQTTSVVGKFTMTVTDLANTPLSLISASSLGLATDFGGLLQVVDDFKVNLAFEINDTAAIPWFDSQQTREADGGQLRTSAGSVFFYTEATSVSEPRNAFILFALLLALGSRRNQQS